MAADEGKTKDRPMSVINRYIVWEIVKGSLIAVLLLVTLFDLFTFSDELDDLGKGTYGLKQIIYYVLLTSPVVFYEVMPASALLGCLFVLGAMGNNRELIAMRAAGISTAGIVKAALMAGAFLVAIAVLVGESIAPISERAAQMIKVTTQNQRIALEAKYGIWLREDNSFINVRRINSDGSLGNIMRYDMDATHHLTQVAHAVRASYLGNKQWRLEQIKQSQVSTEQVTSNTLNDQTWQSSIAPDLLKIAVVKSDNLSIMDLAKYVQFLKHNHQKSQSFELALWGRIVNPLVTFVMILVSVPFVITINRGTNVGARMMIGVVIGMGFNILDRIAGHLGLIYDWSAPIVAFLPSVAVLIIALMALRRVQT
jgi:lipopolysaccharide export system permease protein